jgi:hypothetical protein
MSSDEKKGQGDVHSTPFNTRVAKYIFEKSVAIKVACLDNLANIRDVQSAGVDKLRLLIIKNGFNNTNGTIVVRQTATSEKFGVIDGAHRVCAITLLIADDDHPDYDKDFKVRTLASLRRYVVALYMIWLVCMWVCVCACIGGLHHNEEGDAGRADARIRLT